jgi:hypothetical protein
MVVPPPVVSFIKNRAIAETRNKSAGILTKNQNDE